MKYSLPKWNSSCERHAEPGRGRPNLAALGAILTAFLWVAPLAADPPNAEPGQGAQRQISGQELMARAVAQMTQHPSLEAKLRQRAILFGQPVVGTGTFVQLRHGAGNRFRLDLQVQAGQHSSGLQQLNDGRYLWIHRDQNGKLSLGRVELLRVYQALEAAPQTTAFSSHLWFGIGGLSQLLRGLYDNFAFDSPQADAIGQTPVWRLQGRWKPEAMSRLMSDIKPGSTGDAAAARVELPSHLPHQVSIVLNGDEQLPLFPNRIEFARHDPATDQARPLLIMEWFDIRLRPDLTPEMFAFQIGDQEVQDETDLYLSKLGLVDTAK